MKLLKLTLAVLAAALVTSGAQAVMVDGAITFAGGAIFDTDSLATATRVNTFLDVTVQSRDGDFAAFVAVGDDTTMAVPYIFTPSTPTPGLWSVGGFTFDLDGSVVELQNADFLVISGTGTITGNGFDPTSGMWRFSTQEPDAGGVFSFSSSGEFNGVPDGGSTVALLGLGLTGVWLIRRKFVTA
jgi:VPDSG-CTERM motif